MDDTWKALRRDLLRRVAARGARTQFQQARKRESGLADFNTPAELLRYFDTPGQLDRKDRIYAACVRMAQRAGNARLPVWLIFLGLFPGLDAAHQRVARRREVEPSELACIFWDAFCQIVFAARLERINRVAATIVRSTERDARRAIARQSDNALPLPDDDELVDPKTVDSGASEFGFPPGLPVERELLLLRSALVRVIGNDADLVLGKVVWGDSQRELARVLGTTPALCGERYRRALRRTSLHLRAASPLRSQTKTPAIADARHSRAAGDATELRVAL